MIVRESPNSKKTTSNIQWPPKSPLDAVLCSPNGRKKVRRLLERSVSPSPVKRRRQEEPAIEDDDDEETLQLKLQAIEARLRLKEIQKAKAKKIDAGGGSLQTGDNSRTEVPSSPKRRQPVQTQPESPRRVQLGIDKGVTAREISLRKAKTANNQRSAPIKSFSERLTEARSSDLERRQKQERAKQVRSQGFGSTIKSASSLEDSPSINPGSSAAQSEPFSDFTLSKRHLSGSTVASALKGKEIFSIPKLLKTVTSPHYDPPDTEDDYVVIGIIASKSGAHNPAAAKHKSADESSAPASKFMVIKLTDLEWSVDLFLFDTGFERFWKLTVGTVVAILNPGIMPPKPHLRDTGAFSLKIASSEDTLLEIGSSKDLGFCKSTKRDGQLCGQWVDGRKTEFCEFHVNMQVGKTKAGRMEINSMIGLGSFGQKRASARGGRGGKSGLKPEGAYYDRQAHEMAYVVPKEFTQGAPSAAKLLDADDYVHGGLSKAERSRKRFAAQEKERDMMAKLGTTGAGLGSEYMKAKRGNDLASARRARGEDEREPVDGEEPRDAASLGLIRNDAADVHLSPAKGGKSWTNSMKDGGAGWSKAFQKGLPEKKSRNNVEAEAESLVHITTKRVAVRPRTPVLDDDDDDDGLDII